MSFAKKVSICLNMIVKNEAHIIEETLESIAPYITDYVIVDTGSTDNTITVISNYFNNKHIQGSIFVEEFRNFEYARSIALKHAVQTSKSEYIWIIDADDILCNTPVFPSPMNLDCYLLQYGDGFTYLRCQLFKNHTKYNWHYVGWVHEYPESDIKGKTEGIITGCYVESRRLGDRSKNPNKYLSDALLLEESYRQNPNSRDLFYCGNSYFDHVSMADTFKDDSTYDNNAEKYLTLAKEKYEKRITINEFAEEKFYSYLRLGEAVEKLGMPWSEAEKVYLEGYNFFPARASEAIYRIMMHYIRLEDWENAHKFGRMAINTPFPANCRLFIHKNIYEYSFSLEFAVASSKVGNIIGPYIINKQLNKNISKFKHIESSVTHNVKYFAEIAKEKKSKNCLFYLGDRACESSFIVGILELLCLAYRVYVVGNINIDLCTSENIFIISNKDIPIINFNKVIMIDNLNYLVEGHYHPSKNVVLVQLSNNFSTAHENNKSILIKNNYYLNKYLALINVIISTKDCLQKLCITNKNDILDLDKAIDVEDALTGNITRKYVANPPKTIDQYNNININIPAFVNSSECSNKLKYRFLENVMKGNKFGELSIYYSIIQDLDNNTKGALETINRLKLNTSDGKLVSDMYKAKYLSRLGSYSSSYNIASAAFSKLRLDLNDDHDFYEDIKDRNIEYIKNTFLSYPKLKINKLTPGLDISSAKIIMTITTCKRYNLFTKTINSFINCCNDIHLVDYFICVDDNSSQENRNLMKEKYPFFNYIYKDESNKGHVNSMNIIYNIVALNPNIEKVVHMEDDFLYVSERDYISEACAILDDSLANDNVMQVLFNRNYAEEEFYKRRLPGGIMRSTSKNIRYVVHEHAVKGTDAYRRLEQKYNGKGGVQYYWPHFSFRPSMIKAEAYRHIGEFPHTSHFEMEYAKDYVKSGYKSAFFDNFSCIHIGKKTWESGNNAYSLNNVNQFDKIVPTNIRVVIVGDNNIISNDLKKMFNSMGTPYEIVPTIETPEDVINRLFSSNTFGYYKKQMDKMWTYLSIMKENKSDYLVVVRNTPISVDPKMMQILGNLSAGIFSLSDSVNDSFIISKDMITKVLDYVDSNGIIDNIFENFKYDTIQTLSYDKDYKESIDYINFHNDSIIDGYTFYSQLDSYGNDVRYVGKLSLIELVKICDEENAVGFNTNGYIKNTINPNLCHLYRSTRPTEGLYIKTGHR